jgi:hypothetical protein
MKVRGSPVTWGSVARFLLGALVGLAFSVVMLSAVYRFLIEHDSPSTADLISLGASITLIFFAITTAFQNDRLIAATKQQADTALETAKDQAETADEQAETSKRLVESAAAQAQAATRQASAMRTQAEATKEQARLTNRTLSEVREQRRLANRPWLVYAGGRSDPIDRTAPFPILPASYLIIKNIGTGAAVNVSVCAFVMAQDGLRHYISESIGGIAADGNWEVLRSFEKEGSVVTTGRPDRHRCIIDDLTINPGVDKLYVGIRYQDWFGTWFRTSNVVTRGQPDEYDATEDAEPNWMQCS